MQITLIELLFKEFGNATSISSSNVFNLPQQFSGSPPVLGMVTNPTQTTAQTAYVIGNNTANPPQTITAGQASNGVIQVFQNGILVADDLYKITGTTINFFSNPLPASQTLIVNYYPKQFYKLGQVLYKPSSFPVAEELQRVLREELYHLLKSDLTVPSTTNPIYLYENSQLTVYPTTIVDDIEVAYIRKPIAPVWNFTTGSNNQYIFNASTSFNFELHSAEQTELILKILLYAGVVVRSPEIVQVAAQQVAQENINQQR